MLTVSDRRERQHAAERARVSEPEEKKVADSFVAARSLSSLFFAKMCLFLSPFANADIFIFAAPPCECAFESNKA
jgi:hypothetical protein